MLHNNILFSTISVFSRLISGFVIIFILTKSLTINDFGVFSYSLVFASILVLIIDYGYSIKLVKNIARTKNKISDLTINSIKIKLLLTALVFFFILILYKIQYPDIETSKIIFILTLSLIFNSFANHFLIPYKAIDRFDIEAIYIFIFNVLLLLFVSFISYNYKNVFYVSLAYLFSNILFLLCTFNKFRSDYSMKYSKVYYLSELLNTLPYAIHIAIGTLYLSIDTLILKMFVSNTEIAIYQAGMRAMVASTIGITIISSVMIPKFSELFLNQKQSLIELSTKINFVAIALGIIIAILINMFSNFLIPYIYGLEYVALENYVFYFTIIIFLRYFGLVYGILLTISENQKVRTYGVLATLIFIIILDFIIVPIYYIKGALFILVCAHIILNFIYFYFTYLEFNTTFLNIKYIINRFNR